ncbi:MAG TPA: D-alanyl-D-alanine carboxypeptidase/D-alanyl-D-alanine-endopeptidase [Longimicrobiaceae bacterium]|nr:D-alanyl-D-alanine carboxypeptidase/D-alanyl-D-alanine-endopeptidase [Longimicrobiaceae bacterium]
MPRTLRLALAAALLPALAACHPRLVPGPAPAAAPSAERALAAGLDSIFADTAFAHAHWGVLVRSLDRGDVLYEREAGKLVVPASNMKIVTGAVALEALGPDYRFRTRVASTGAARGGTLQGDLVVTGGGDPTIAAHFTGGDSRAVFRAWADSLRARRITRLSGSVVGVDDVFDDVPLGRGWAWDDLDASYSAEVSGLELNEGMATVRVAPGTTIGSPATVTVEPATAYLPVTNAATTGAPGSAATVEIGRPLQEAGIVVTGSIPSDTTGVSDEVAVRDNALYFATVLRESLIAAGIRVDGTAEDADTRLVSIDTAALQPLFTHSSPPLREVLAGFLKPSQNQIGEMLLKTLGHELRGGPGSARSGAAVVDSVLRTWGLPSARLLAQADGSGLSRYDLVAPELLAGILAHMARSPNWAVWYQDLPIAGVDGTLAARMKGTPLAGNVHAKTGTLTGVRSLSGYLTTAGGEHLVFSIIANNHTLSSRDVDRVAEAALLRAYTLRR